jgi:hypothetical protein
MTEPLTLTGDEHVPALPMTEAQVNHLRRLLAWMRVEYCLDENMQAGCLDAVTILVAHGDISVERGQEELARRAAHINRVPAYLRQGVKMLTKALRDHERAAGIVEAS